MAENSGTFTYWIPTDLSDIREEANGLLDQEIEDRATEDANGREVSTDNKELSTYQKMIQSRIGNGCVQLRNIYFKDLGAANVKLNELKGRIITVDSKLSKKIEGESDKKKKEEMLIKQHPEVNKNIDKLIKKEHDGIFDLTAKAFAKYQDLLMFRKDNSLIGTEAVYPDSNLVNWCLIGFMLIAETILNGTLFQKAVDNSGGLIEGIQLALFFSIVNIVLGGFLGFFALRNSIHVNMTRKVCWRIMAAIVILIGLIWNGFIAHFRENIVIGVSEETLADTAKLMFSDPFNIGSVPSYALFIIGTSIFLYVAYKFYRVFDDPYPQYGATDRRYKSASEDLEFGKQRVRDVLSKDAGDARRKISGISDENKSVINRAEKIVSDLNNQLHEIIASINGHIALGNRQLDLYRRAYSYHRGEEPVFRKRMKFADYVSADQSKEMTIETANTALEAIKIEQRESEPGVGLLYTEMFEFETFLAERLEKTFSDIEDKVRKTITPKS